MGGFGGGGGVGEGGGVNGGGGGGGGVDSDGSVGSFMGNSSSAAKVRTCQARVSPSRGRVLSYASDYLPSSEQNWPDITTHEQTSMRPPFVRLLFFAFLLVSLTAPSKAPARSMLDIPGVPVSALQVYLPNEAYQKLVNAPIKAYIQVRGQVGNNKVTGARIA